MGTQRAHKSSSTSARAYAEFAQNALERKVVAPDALLYGTRSPHHLQAEGVRPACTALSMEAFLHQAPALQLEVSRVQGVMGWSPGRCVALRSHFQIPLSRYINENAETA